MKKEILQKFYSQYRLYIFPIVVAISSLILIAFVISPQIVKLVENSKLETDFKGKAKFLEAKAQTLENYDEVGLNRKVKFSLTAFPQEKDFANVMALLQRLTHETSFTIASLGFVGSNGNQQGKTQSYNVKLEILGPKIFLANLVSSIETSPRLMRVNSIDITSTKEVDVITADLIVEVLFSSLPVSFGSADSPLPTLSSQEEELVARLASQISISQPSISVSPRGKVNPFE